MFVLVGGVPYLKNSLSRIAGCEMGVAVGKGQCRVYNALYSGKILQVLFKD